MSARHRWSRRSLLSSMLAAPILSQARAANAADLPTLFAASDEAQLRLNPMNATWRGDLRFADQFGDLITDAYLDAVAANAAKDLAAIKAFARDKLSPTEQIEYDVFRQQAEFTVRSNANGSARINAQDFALDHLNGLHMSFPQAMAADSQFPYANVQDYENALKLHAGFATYLDRTIIYLRRGAARGNVHFRGVAERLVAQFRDIVAAGVDGSPLLTPTAHFPQQTTTKDRGRLTGAFRESIATVVLPAHQRVLTFLETEYLPRTRTSTPGLAGLPSGRLLYRYALEFWTTAQLDPDEVHDLGLAEVTRIRTEMDRIRTAVGFNGDLAAFSAYLKTDQRFKFATREDYLAAYQVIWENVRPKLSNGFSSVPTLPFEIRPVPEAMESATGGAYYMPGTPDGSRAGVFFVNTSNLPSRTSPNMTALFLHEATPGHHLQSATAMENKALPAFLRFQWNAGYGEGWALYAERLGIEMGLYSDPYQYFGMLDLEIFRACRLVIDSGLHARGWSRDQAIQFMTANTTLDSNFIALEIDRYIVTPGQATSYKVGELAIRRLRRKAESALGARFDLRSFHDQVLNTGAIPLTVLERKVDDWIQRQRI